MNNLETELNIIYEDDDLLVLNKPSGLPVLKDRSGIQDLWAILKRHFKPYQVHRLDKGTSGVMVVAKNQKTQSSLTRQFSKRDVKKYYTAVVSGVFPASASIEIDLAICKGRKSRYRIAAPRAAIKRIENRYQVDADREGVEAQTRVRVLTQTANQSLLVLSPLTGRTHQLRVHLSWLGHPILGDHLYGPADNKEQSSRLLLHAHKLVLPDRAVFTAPIPSDWQSLG